MATLFNLPQVVPVTSGGVPYAGAKMYFYGAGGLVAQTVYTDLALSVPHAQPVVADSNGRFAAIYLTNSASNLYRVQIKTSADALIYDQDNIPAGYLSGGLTISSGGLTVTGNSYIAGSVTLGTTNPVTFSNAGIVGITGDNSNASLDVFTPNAGTTGGIRLRGNLTSGNAILQATNSTAGTQWGFLKITSAAKWLFGGLSGTHALSHNDSGGNQFNTGWLESPTNPQATPYTAVLSDSGKTLYYSGTGAAAFTIPANASVAYPLGTRLTFINDATGATNMTIAITTDTMILSPGGTTGSRTLAQYGKAIAEKVTSTRWVISGSGLT